MGTYHWKFIFEFVTSNCVVKQSLILFLKMLGGFFTSVMNSWLISCIIIGGERDEFF